MLRVAGWVLHREVREAVRDPHALVFLVFPLALYPLLVWALVQGALVREGWVESARWTIDVEGPEALRAVVLGHDTATGGGEEALRRGRADVVVRGTQQGGRFEVEVVHASVRASSAAARAQVVQRLEAWRDERVRALRAEAGVAAPWTVQRRTTASHRALFDHVAGLLLGLVLPVMASMAGLYPAIDLVVGERERNTLETTLVSPVSRSAVLLGRVAAVATLVFASGVGNVVGLVLTVAQLAHSLFPDEVWVPGPALLAVGPPLLAASLLIAVGYLLVLLPARTFKEGEYLGSLAAVAVMLAPLAALRPLLEQDPGHAERWVPLANLVLVVAHALERTVTVPEVVVATGTNLAAALALGAVLHRIVTSEGWVVDQALPAWLAWVRRGMPS